MIPFPVDRLRGLYRSPRHGTVIPLALGAVVAIGALFALLYFTWFRPDTDATINAIYKPVTRGEFVAKVLDQGEVQSADNVEIKCLVGSRNGSINVIDVVSEGTYVRGGDWLVTLDATAFQKELEQQRIAVSNAQTEVIQARAALTVAEESKKEYETGTFPERERTIMNELFNAKQELEQARNFLDHSLKLLRKGFYLKQELEADRIAVERAENAVALAEQQLLVLRDITFNKEIVQFDSDIEAAKVKFESAVEQKAIEESQLAEIEKQISYCTVSVPPGVEGEVVYHKEFDRRGGSEWVLEPGASVREQQVLIKIPNPTKMEVKVLINEQSITFIQPNMPATISVDALAGKSLKGYVTKVNSYAEQGGFMGSSSVREYAIFVRIIDPPKQLIPGMNASVNIQTEYQADVLQAALQCIYSANDSYFVLRRVGDHRFETVEVQIAGENSQNVWIESGVEEGDLLVMDPGQFKELMDLPELQQDTRIDLPEGLELTSTTGPRDEQRAPIDGAGDGARLAGGPSDGAEGDGARGEGGRRGRRGGDGAQGDGEGWRGGGAGGGGGGGGFSPQMIVDRMLERYDTNGDGKIDAAEQEGFDDRARMIGDADSNGDGEITRDEIEKAAEGFMEQMRQRMQQQGGGFGPPGGA